MSLTNKTVASSYKDVVSISNSNSGIDGTTRNVMSGNGNTCGLHLSTNNTLIKSASNSSTALQVQNSSGTNLFQVDTTNTLVKARGVNVNTGIKHFSLGSVNGHPSSTNWTMLTSSGESRFNATPIEMGSSTTPDTSYTVSTTAQNLVQAMWYVPVSITIDACYVWFGADAASGDVVKFSVMSYDIDQANSTTSGDLTNGVENCVSASTISGAGYEQAYYQSLTVSTADVDKFKVITANVLQDGTNADLTISLQLVYHLRG